MPNIKLPGESHSPLFLKIAKIWPFYGKNWSSPGPSNWFFLNHNQYAQGCSMPNFKILGVSHSPLFLKMAKIWPFYGQTMVLTWSLNLVLLEFNQCAQGCILWPTFLKKGQSMSLLWQKHGPNMVL